MTPRPIRNPLEPSERDFQRQIIDLAHMLGWKVAHFRPALNSHGRWMTAVQGDGAGFPDLVLVRDRVMFAELKAGRAKPTVEQASWLFMLAAAGVEVHLWRPADLDDIARILQRRGPEPVPARRPGRKP